MVSVCGSRVFWFICFYETDLFAPRRVYVGRTHARYWSGTLPYIPLQELRGRLLMRGRDASRRHRSHLAHVVRPSIQCASVAFSERFTDHSQKQTRVRYTQDWKLPTVYDAVLVAAFPPPLNRKGNFCTLTDLNHRSNLRKSIDYLFVTCRIDFIISRLYKYVFSNRINTLLKNIPLVLIITRLFIQLSFAATRKFNLINSET